MVVPPCDQSDAVPDGMRGGEIKRGPFDGQDFPSWDLHRVHRSVVVSRMKGELVVQDGGGARVTRKVEVGMLCNVDCIRGKENGKQRRFYLRLLNIVRICISSTIQHLLTYSASPRLLWQ